MGALGEMNNIVGARQHPLLDEKCNYTCFHVRVSKNLQQHQKKLLELLLFWESL